MFSFLFQFVKGCELKSSGITVLNIVPEISRFFAVHITNYMLLKLSVPRPSVLNGSVMLRAMSSYKSVVISVP